MELAGWLVGWLIGWLVGWLVGWLIGWLVSLLVSCTCLYSERFLLFWGLFVQYDIRWHSVFSLQRTLDYPCTDYLCRI